jgi:hypothetical protein
VIPDIVKPAPVNVAEVIVKGRVPEEVRIMDWTWGDFITTSPNVNAVPFKLNVGTAATRFNEKAAEALSPLAVTLTVCAAVTAETVAENPTLEELAGTVTIDGTVTAELLLARLRSTPPLPAGPFSVTVQESVAAPVIEEVAQVSELTVASPATPDSV